MRFLASILFSTLALGVLAKRQTFAPRILSVQINRCPTPTTYSNVNEKEQMAKIMKSSSPKTVMHSELEETIRFSANETGTVQIFVVGRGNFSVDVQSDQGVFTGLDGVFHVDATQGGALISLPFKVIKAIRETKIDVLFNTRTIEKTITIYANTKTLQPPRPPSLYTSMIFTAEEAETIMSSGTAGSDGSSQDPNNNNNVPSPKNTTNVEETDGSLNVTNSAATIEQVEFPSVSDVLNGSHSSPKSNTLRLDSITLNRITADKTDRFVSESNVYLVTIKKFEKGQIMFYVSGNGNKKVTVRSLTEARHSAKVMTVSGDYAAFGYTDGVNYVDEDHILVKLENDLDEVLYYYLVMNRVD